ncbi:MAG: SDR family NAD(P)-dependent oxidoreductase, partial [Thermoanaerobaculia bacterium]|nr:SDR family NAD(P)-dependent oxidoreductase [Thermoanaerobaculia bacterium]
MSETSRPVCVVIGVGPGNGAACARRFAAEGHAVALLARNQAYLESLAAEIEGSRAFAYDATSAAAATEVLSRIRDEMGPVSVLVYNAGSGVFGDFDAVSPEDLEAAWRVNTYGLLLAAKQVVP